MIELEKSNDSVDQFTFMKTEQLPLSDPEKPEPKAMSDSVDAVSVDQELPQSHSEPRDDLFGPDVNAPIEAEDELVNVDLRRSLSNSSNIAEDDGVLCGPSSEHFTDEMEMDKEDLTTVIFYPDHMVYRDSYCTDCVLTFTSSCITIEGSTVDDDDKTLRFQWGVQDIRHIKSHWYGLVGMAMVTIHVLDDDAVHVENVECTSGTELKFAVTGANWYGKREAVTSLNIVYKILWSSMLESEELDNGHTLASFTKYFPNFDQPFEEVIYPKGDVDAVSISKREVDMLLPDTFVNDTIIDFYIKYLKNKIKPEDIHRFHFFNSFFFRKLADPEKGPLDASEGKAAFHHRVRKWTRKVNIFEKDYVFIPVNYNYHWSLIVMCHLGEVATYKDKDVTKSIKVPCVLHMDSIRGSHTGLKALMQSYMKEEWKGRQQDASEDISSRFDNLRFISLELPQQPNSFDCGLFLLHYVELFLEQAPVYFNPFHITKSVNFLNEDWFTPADASLKRVVIQRLVYDLLEQPSHKASPSISANDNNNIEKETAVNFFPVMCNNPSTVCQTFQDDHGIEGIEGIEMSLLPSLSLTSEPCPVGPTASSKPAFETGSFLGMQFPSFNETMFDGYKCSLAPPIEEDRETSGQFVYSSTEIDLQQDNEIEIIPEITYSSQKRKKVALTASVAPATSSSSHKRKKVAPTTSFSSHKRKKVASASEIRETPSNVNFDAVNCYRWGQDGHVGQNCPRGTGIFEMARSSRADVSHDGDGRGGGGITNEGVSADAAGGDVGDDDVVGSDAGTSVEGVEGDDGSVNTLFNAETSQPRTEELDLEYGDVTYVPDWSVLCKHTTRDPQVCREMLDHFSTPHEVLRWRNMTDGALESRYNVLLAQLSAVGSEVRGRWSTRANDCGRLRARLQKRTGLLKKRDDRIERLKIKLKTEKKKKVHNLRKYEAETLKVASLVSQVEDLKRQNTEFLARNQVLEEKASLPNLPPGAVSILQVELDCLMESLAQAERDTCFTQNLLASKEKAWATERVTFDVAIHSLNETNQSLIEKNAKLFEDRNWLICEGVKEFVSKLHDSREFLGPHGEVCQIAQDAGFVEGVKTGYRHSRLKTPMSQISRFDSGVDKRYDDALVHFSQISFPYLDNLAASSELSLDEIRKIVPTASLEE